MNSEEYEALRGVVCAAAVLYFPRAQGFAELEDLEQEAWVAAIEAAAKKDPQNAASLVTYVFPKIHWALKDYCKRLKGERRKVSMDAVLHESEDEYCDDPRTLHDVIGIAPTQEHGLLLEDVQKGLERKFPKQTAEIVMLRAQGFSYKEIAERLKTTPEAVQVAFSRAYTSSKRRAA